MPPGQPGGFLLQIAALPDRAATYEPSLIVSQSLKTKTHLWVESI
jgi:hypothetical protein